MNAKEAVTQSKSDFIAWAQKAPLRELKKVFSECSPHGKAYMWDIAKTEINARQHRWTVWGFWIMVMTLIFAAIAASPVIQSWFGKESPSEEIEQVQQGGVDNPINAQDNSTSP